MQSFNDNLDKELFFNVRKIQSIDLLHESYLIRIPLEFIENNFNLGILKVYKVKLFGFPYKDTNISYFQSLKKFLENNKKIFALEKISFVSHSSEANFFTKFNSEEFYLLITNYIGSLFDCYCKSGKSVNLNINFLKLVFPFSLNELYFYIFSLSQISQQISYVKVKYMHCKYSIYKHLNVEYYKKFLKDFLSLKNFSFYKFQNEEHFMKIYSKANYENIIIKEKSKSNIKQVMLSKNEIIDKIKNEIFEIKETELDMLSESSASGSSSFKNFEYKHSCYDDQEPALDIDDGFGSDLNNQRFSIEALKKSKYTSRNTKNKNLNEHYCDSYENFNKINNYQSYEINPNDSFEQNQEDFNEKLLFNEYCDKNSFNLLIQENDECLMKENDDDNKMENKNNIDIFEIKNLSKFFESLKFKMKNSIKTLNKHKIVIPKILLSNQIVLNNLLNLEVKFDNKNDFFSKSKKFIFKFPSCLEHLDFEFLFFEIEFVNEIFDCLIMSDLRKINKLTFNFENLNLNNIIYRNSGKEYNFSITTEKFLSGVNFQYSNEEKCNIVDIDELNNKFKNVIKNNNCLKRFVFNVSKIYLIKNKHRIYDSKENNNFDLMTYNISNNSLNRENYNINQNLSNQINNNILIHGDNLHVVDPIFNRFSSINICDTYDFDLFFISKNFLYNLSNTMINKRDKNIKLDLSTNNFSSILQNIFCWIDLNYSKRNFEIERTLNNNGFTQKFDYNKIPEYKTYANHILNDLQKINFFDFLEYLSSSQIEEIKQDNLSFFINNLRKITFQNFRKEVFKQISRYNFFNKCENLENLKLIYSDSQISDSIDLNFFENIHPRNANNLLQNCVKNYQLDQELLNSIIYLFDPEPNIFSKNYFINNCNENFISFDLKNQENIHPPGISNFSFNLFKNLKYFEIKNLNWKDKGFSLGFVNLFANLFKSYLKKLHLSGKIEFDDLNSIFDCIHINRNKNFSHLIKFQTQNEFFSGFEELNEKFHELFLIKNENIIINEFVILE